MAWCQLSTLLGFALLTSISIEHSQAVEFISSPFTALVNEDTRPGEVIQQVIALPSSGLSNVTYSLEQNIYIDINIATGEIKWKGVGTLLENDTKSYAVYAMDYLTKEQTTSNVTLANTTVVCPCFTSQQLEVVAKVSENLELQTLVYFSGKSCSDNVYTLQEDMSNLLEVNEGRLIIHPLDYEAKPVLRTAITCRNETAEVTINVEDVVDLRPYTLGIGRKKQSFVQYNYTVDADRPGSILGKESKKFLVFFMDAKGSSDKWNITKLYDPYNQLIMEPLKVLGSKNGMITVLPADQLLIDRSTDIDIVIIDGNFPSAQNDKPAVNSTMTYRFSFKLQNVNELKSLELLSSYALSISENTPKYTQVLRIGHDFTKALYFDLEPAIGFTELRHCTDMLKVTPHQGIVYVTGSWNITLCGGSALYNLTVTQNGLERHSQLNVTLQPAPSVTGSHLISCADYTSESNCSGGRGAGSARCLWKSVINTKSNFTTCVPNNDCTNLECSELEALDRSICPQDCLNSSEWRGDTIQMCANSNHKGVCHANGVCHCAGNAEYCICLPAEEVGVITFRFNASLEPLSYRNRSVVTPVSDQVCGLQCTVIISVIAAFVIVVIVVVSLWYRYRPAKLVHKVDDGINAFRVGGIHLNTNLTPNPGYEESTPSTVLSMFTEWPDSLYHNTFDEKWELSRENLIIGDYIGEGEFGRVMKAKYRKCLLDDWSPVAVKMLKDGASRTEYNDLLSEYNLLKEVNHPNVIKLIGAATMSGPFHLVVEYCELGSLKSYLRGIRTQEPIYVNGATQFYSEYADQLMSFSYQISKGMQYLAEIKLVHRDLATRNILIAADKVIKISDFGMTKDIYEEDAYKKKGQGRIPVKWMAPESLFHLTYTAKSDVWSFGILLWEIATLGATPYPGIPAERMYNLLQEGYRMHRPETCSIALYSLMKRCWDYDEATRPSFKELRHSLEKMLEDKESNYLDLSVAAQSRRQCHGSSSISTGSSEEGSETQQLTVALLPSNESKFVEDYLISTSDGRDKEERQPLRYTTLEFADDD